MRSPGMLAQARSWHHSRKCIGAERKTARSRRDGSDGQFAVHQNVFGAIALGRMPPQPCFRGVLHVPGRRRFIPVFRPFQWISGYVNTQPAKHRAGAGRLRPVQRFLAIHAVRCIPGGAGRAGAEPASAIAPTAKKMRRSMEEAYAGLAGTQMSEPTFTSPPSTIGDNDALPARYRK